MTEHELPRVVVKFLRWICPGEMLEEIEGDLIQRYTDEIRVAVGEGQPASCGSLPCVICDPVSCFGIQYIYH